MANDIETLKSIIIKMDSDNYKTQSTLIDRFLKDYSLDIKYKLLEMWTEFLLQQEEGEKFFSNN